MGHLELGTHRPATGLVYTLQISDAQEDMTPFAGSDTHLAVAMGTYQLIAAHNDLLSDTHNDCS